MSQATNTSFASLHVQHGLPNDAVFSNAPEWLPNGGSELGSIDGVNRYYYWDIMGGAGQPPCQGPGGNKCGRNVYDNDLYIIRSK